MSAPATCRSCDAEVVFVPSAKSGRPMILDAEPRKGVVLTDRTMTLHGLVGLADEIDVSSEARVVDVYTDHHATCPAAGEWKGRRR